MIRLEHVCYDDKGAYTRCLGINKGSERRCGAWIFHGGVDDANIVQMSQRYCPMHRKQRRLNEHGQEAK